MLRGSVAVDFCELLWHGNSFTPTVYTLACVETMSNSNRCFTFL